jgi:transposase, IS5 family
MSLNTSGIGLKVVEKDITISIRNNHPLIKLANNLPWEEMTFIVLEDLKNTSAGQWWTGRPLMIRIHLGAFILQKLHDLEDRATEYFLNDNAAVQLFCGKYIVDKWHAPDHTKIAEFRSRLKIETQRALANIIVQHAHKLGFADPSIVDIDSTIQEANMSYPSDVRNLTKIAEKAKKILDFFIAKGESLGEAVSIDFKKIKKLARKCFFMAKNAPEDEKTQAELQVLKSTKQESKPIINACVAMSEEQLNKLPWNIKDAVIQLREHALQYFKDAKIYFTERTAAAGKKLAFHLSEVSCFNKGKKHKKNEFGRCFQMMRIAGNFLFALPNASVENNDKESIAPAIYEHAKAFGENNINSFSSDKGYYSKKNETMLIKNRIAEIGMQRPDNINRKKLLTPEKEEKLANRRSGIEPLIGHAKHKGQLGRSRMKSDEGTESAGFASIMGFNLRQLIRHVTGKIEFAVAT